MSSAASTRLLQGGGSPLFYKNCRASKTDSRALDLFPALFHTVISGGNSASVPASRPVPARLVAACYPEDKEKPKCPAEENANCEKSPPTSARRSCGKTDTRTNDANFKTAGFEIGLIC